MTYVSLDDAVKQLPMLVEEAARGEKIILTQNAAPVAEIVAVPLSAPVPPRDRVPGSAKGLIIHIAPDFDEPLEDFKDYS